MARLLRPRGHPRLDRAREGPRGGPSSARQVAVLGWLSSLGVRMCPAVTDWRRVSVAHLWPGFADRRVTAGHRRAAVRLYPSRKLRRFESFTCHHCDVSGHRRQGEPSGFTLFRVLGWCRRVGSRGNAHGHYRQQSGDSDGDDPADDAQRKNQGSLHRIQLRHVRVNAAEEGPEQPGGALRVGRSRGDRLLDAWARSRRVLRTAAAPPQVSGRGPWPRLRARRRDAAGRPRPEGSCRSEGISRLGWTWAGSPDIRLPARSSSSSSPTLSEAMSAPRPSKSRTRHRTVNATSRGYRACHSTTATAMDPRTAMV